MNRKRFGLGGLLVSLLCLGTARAEDMAAPYTGPGAPPGAIPPGATIAPGPGMIAQPSDWLAYPRCQGCCGPVGANGPINYEVYLRNGFDFPLGGNPFGTRLDPGYEISGGARTLFFNPESDAAWTADIGIANVYNISRDRTTTYTLLNVFDNSTNTTLPSVAVNIKSLNRTYVNLAGGREWYLMGSANCDEPGTNVRVGVDLGGRYGTEKLNVTNFVHRTDTNAGVFIAVHSDVEIPCGCCIFQAGIRSEYGYTWSDILQTQNNGDIQDITLMLNLGVRF